MSRLGDEIRKAREQSGMTARACAKKAGVSEGYLLDVENGRRIPDSGVAERLLKVLGGKTSALGAMEQQADREERRAEQGAVQPFSLRAAGDRQTPPPKPVKPAKPEEISGEWREALGALIKRIKVIDSAGKTIAYREEVVDKGRIMGVSSEKLLYFRVPDNNLKESLAISKGDDALIAPGKQGLLLAGYEKRRLLCHAESHGADTVLISGSERLQAPAKDIEILGSVIKIVRDIKQ